MFRMIGNPLTPGPAISASNSTSSLETRLRSLSGEQSINRKPSLKLRKSSFSARALCTKKKVAQRHKIDKSK